MMIQMGHMRGSENGQLFYLGNKEGIQSIHVSYAYGIAEQKTNIGNRNSGQLEKV